MARCSGDMEADPNAFTSVGHTPAAAKQASETSERCDMRSSAALMQQPARANLISLKSATEER